MELWRVKIAEKKSKTTKDYYVLVNKDKDLTRLDQLGSAGYGSQRLAVQYTGKPTSKRVLVDLRDRVWKKEVERITGKPASPISKKRREKFVESLYAL